MTFVVLAVAIGVRADDKKPTDKPFDDVEFVMMAASGGMAEVELGKIGAERGKSDTLKKFANRLIKDHTKANKTLKTTAMAAGIEVPTKINEKQQKYIDMFKDYKGDDFDREYAKHMVKDHVEDIELFTRASKEAKNADLKAFAEKTLPVLKEHLEMAKNLDK